jgi:hypothetical protein
MQEDKT